MKQIPEHPQYTNWKPDWTMCRDCYIGDKAIKTRKGKKGWPGSAYLIPLKKQESDDFADYVERAEFFNGMGRSIEGLRGMVFSKPPIWSMPESMQEHLQDITLTGVSADTLLTQITNEILTVGRVGILVDYPRQTESIVTRADAEMANLRPYWKLYTAEQICFWGTRMVGNRSQLSDLYLIESDTQVRWLLIDESNTYQQVLLTKEKEQSEWTETMLPTPLIGGKAINEIPFHFIGVTESQPDIEKPPLIDLAKVNIAHYRNSADYENALHLIGSPTPCLAGFSPPPGKEEIDIGAKSVLVSTDPSFRWGFLELTGGGLSTLAEAMKTKEERMAVLGSRLLTQERRQVEAAETAAIHRSGEIASLSSIAFQIERAVDWALAWHARWMGIEPNDEIYCVINKEFLVDKPDPAMIQAHILLYQNGCESKEMLFRYLKKIGEIDQDEDFDAMERYIAINPPPGAGSYVSPFGGGSQAAA